MSADAVETESVYQGPKRAVKRAVLLAHGAGADMNAATLTTVADALADAKIASLRFNFPYKAAGRKSPDRPPVLLAAVRAAAADLAKRTKIPVEQLVMGGRSMGGRICSMVAAEDGAAGLVLLGYPLHPPGRADNLRIEHFPKLKMPVLFVSGTRDAFGSPDELKQHARKLKGKVSWHWIETGDHGFKTLKSSGISTDVALSGAAEAVVSFVTNLPA